MKKSLLSLSDLFSAVITLGYNLVVVVRDYVGKFDPIFLTVAEPAPERRDLLEHGMPEQPAPHASATRIQRDQRPALRLFTTARNDFAF